MSERIVTGYKRLFEVRLLHHYWLDEGSTLFDSLSESRRNKLLLLYDARNYLSVVPTKSTREKLHGLKAVFKTTAAGFLVAISKTTQIADNEVFNFVITATDPAFFNYTALTLSKNRIYEIYHSTEDKIYRFKENVPVFSNVTGASRGAGANKTLFLSKEIPLSSPADKAEFLNLSSGSLLQLLSSQPAAITQQISSVAANAPVFFHQNDSPALLPPHGLSGTPAKGIQLTDGIADQVLGLVSISATRPTDPDFSCTSGGLAKQSCPVFQIRFRNRSAFWKYINKNTGVPVSETATALPFTFAGNAGVKKKPGNSPVKVKFESNNPTKRIIKIYTEIFE